MRCTVCNTTNIYGARFCNQCGTKILPTNHYWLTPQDKTDDEFDEFEYIDDEPNQNEQPRRGNRRIVMDEKLPKKTSTTDWGTLLGAFAGGVIAGGVAVAALMAMDDD